MGANASYHQYEPLRVPQNWGTEEKKLVLQLTDVLDDIFSWRNRLRFEDMHLTFRNRIVGTEGQVTQLEISNGQISAEVSSAQIYRASSEAVLLAALAAHDPVVDMAVGLLWYDTTNRLMKRCTVVSPLTWEVLSTDSLHTSFIDILENRIDIGSTGEINIGAGGAVNIESSGEINIEADGAVNVASGGTVSVASGGSVEIASGGDITLSAGGKLNVAAGDINLTVDDTLSDVVSALNITDGNIIAEVSSTQVYRAADQTALLAQLTAKDISLAVGIIWYDTTNRLMKRCTVVSPVTWETLETTELHTSYIDIADSSIDIGSSGDITIAAGGSLNVAADDIHLTAEDSLSDAFSALDITDGNIIAEVSSTQVYRAVDETALLAQLAAKDISLAAGILWYDTTTKLFKRYTGSAWEVLETNAVKSSYIELRNDAIDVSSTGHIDIQSGASLNVESGGDIDVASGGDIDIQSGGNLNVLSGGDIHLASGGDLEIDSGGNLNVNSGGDLHVQSGGDLDIESGGNLNIKSGGDIEVEGGGDINIASTGKMNIASGGELNIASGGSLNLSSASQIVIGTNPLLLGGTNLLTSTSSSYTSEVFSSQYYHVLGTINLPDVRIPAGSTLTARAYLNLDANPLTGMGLYIQDYNGATYAGVLGNVISASSDGFSTATYQLRSDATSVRVYLFAQNAPTTFSGTEQYKLLKLEIGSVATDWSPAPEDTTNAIAAAVSGRTTIFYQTSQPTATATGDLWYDTDATPVVVYRWSGSAWVNITTTALSAALEAASDAQSTADGKIVVFAQASVPTSTAIGDLWIDTDDSNKMYRAASVGADEIKAGEWILYRVAAGNVATNTITLDDTGIAVESTGVIDIKSGANLNIKSGGDIEVEGGGDINVASTGRISVSSGGDIEIYSGADINVNSGGNLNVLSGGDIHLASGGDLEVDASGNLNVNSGANLNVKSGGDIEIESGGDINVASGGNITVASGGNIDIQAGGTLKLASGFGGTNLVPDSNNVVNWDKWSVQTLLATYADTVRVYRAIGDTTTIGVKTPGTFKIANGRTYTISYNSYSLYDGVMNYLYVLSAGGNIFVSTANKVNMGKSTDLILGTTYANRYSITFTCPRDVTDARILFGYYSDTGYATVTGFYLSKVKIEEGTVATDWSPSPSDPASGVVTSHVTIEDDSIEIASGGSLTVTAPTTFAITAGATDATAIAIRNDTDYFLSAGDLTQADAPFWVKKDGSIKASKIQQEYSQSFWDLADATYPAEFPVYIPSGYTVDTVTFTFVTGKYRSFAKAASTPSTTYTSTPDTDYSGGPSSDATGSASGNTAGGGSHSHTVVGSSTDTVLNHTHGLNSHTHTLGAHYHGLNAHKHTLNSHTHGLTYGIYEKSALATSCDLKIGATTIGTYSPNPASPVEIKTYLSAGWNTVVVQPNNDARIAAYLLVKLTPT